MPLGHRSQCVNALFRHFVQRKAFIGDAVVARVGTRQHQNAVDQVRKMRRLGADDLQRVAIFAVASIPRQCHLCLAADDRDRRPQFVRCVGEQTLLLFERALQSLEEGIEHGAQASELVGGIRKGYALGEILRFDARSDFRHPRHRRQTAKRQEIANCRRNNERCGNGDGHGLP